MARLPFRLFASPAYVRVGRAYRKCIPPTTAPAALLPSSGSDSSTAGSNSKSVSASQHRSVTAEWTVSESKARRKVVLIRREQCLAVEIAECQVGTDILVKRFRVLVLTGKSQAADPVSQPWIERGVSPPSSLGICAYSYRSPIFSVSFGLTFQSSRA